MLEVVQLTKKYNKKTLGANNVNFIVQPGEICILLGPNGAGKSTTIKSIAGLLRFEGNIRVSGFNNHSIDAKKIFAYAPETPALYELLTVSEHLEFIAKAYDLKDYEAYRDQLLKRFDLDDKLDKIGRELSKGMQQKVSLCCAALIRPQIFLFDEPMIGLDPKAINELKKLFLELKKDGCALLISTHIIDSIEGYWDRVLIMNNGEVVVNITKDELVKKGENLEHLFFSVTELPVTELSSTELSSTELSSTELSDDKPEEMEA